MHAGKRTKSKHIFWWCVIINTYIHVTPQPWYRNYPLPLTFLMILQLTPVSGNHWSSFVHTKIIPLVLEFYIKAHCGDLKDKRPLSQTSQHLFSNLWHYLEKFRWCTLPGGIMSLSAEFWSFGSCLLSVCSLCYVLVVQGMISQLPVPCTMPPLHHHGL